MAKINLNELIADREAGTGGSWVSELDEDDEIAITTDNGYLVTYAFPNGDDCRDINARRIARLPDLEAAYIEAVELLRDAADQIECFCDASKYRNFLEKHS